MVPVMLETMRTAQAGPLQEETAQGISLALTLHLGQKASQRSGYLDRGVKNTSIKSYTRFSPSPVMSLITADLPKYQLGFLQLPRQKSQLKLPRIADSIYQPP